MRTAVLKLSMVGSGQGDAATVGKKTTQRLWIAALGTECLKTVEENPRNRGQTMGASKRWGKAAKMRKNGAAFPSRATISPPWICITAS